MIFRHGRCSLGCDKFKLQLTQAQNTDEQGLKDLSHVRCINVRNYSFLA